MKRTQRNAARLLALLALFTIAGSGAAQAEALPSAQSADGPVIVEVRPEDGIPLTPDEIADLKLKETIEVPPAGSVVDLESGVVSEPARAGGIQPRTGVVACSGRTDFYRWRGPNGTICFANAGEIHLSKFQLVSSLCPGSNRGHTYYYYGNTWYWSSWRGPVSNHNTCYSFGTTVGARGVAIS